jgi:tight adherence protein B
MPAAVVGAVALGAWLGTARAGQGRARRVLGLRRVRCAAWVARRMLPARQRLPLAVLALGAGLGLALGSPVPPVLAPPAALVLRRRRDRAAAGRAAAALRRGVVALCVALVAELRAGRGPQDALAAAVGTLDGPTRAALVEVLGAARVGGDVPDALERAAARPGAAGLRRVAACWRIAIGRGGGFAPALERVAAALRAEEDAHEEVLAELAGARSTARLLAGLPVFGLVLGSGLGARPVDVLLRTPYGVVCLVVGLALVVVGLAWTDRLAGGSVVAGAVR